MTNHLHPAMVQARSHDEACAIVHEMHPNAFIDAFDILDGSAHDGHYDVLVWATEADADGDDGQRAIARYTVAKAD